MSKAPVDPDADAYGIFAIYGATMLAVQTLEMAISMLVLVAETDPKKESNASIQRQLKKAVKQSQEAFQRNPVSVLRNRLRGKIRTCLYDEISAFIPKRNRLAHSFLREQMILGDSEGRFKPGTARELTEHSIEIGGLRQHVIEERDRILATFPPAESESSEMETLGTALAKAIMLREAPDA
jgi:hypothetical protein